MLESHSANIPTEHFNILKPKNPPIDVSDQQKICRGTKVCGLKKCDIRSGSREIEDSFIELNSFFASFCFPPDLGAIEQTYHKDP